MKPSRFSELQLKMSRILFFLAIPMLCFLPFMETLAVKILLCAYIICLAINGMIILCTMRKNRQNNEK